MDKQQRKTVFSWALYDWANSAYSITVMTVFFPVFLKDYWAPGLAVESTTFYLGLANSVASLAVVVAAPILGAIADRGGMRKRFLLFAVVLGVAMTAVLAFLAQGQWVLAVATYVLATLGFSGGNVFYDSLLPGIAPKGRLDSVSSLGYALGYLGSGLLFILCVLMTRQPEFFGLSDAAQAVKVCFVIVALWWAGFSIPLFLVIKEPPRAPGVAGSGAVYAGFRQLARTFREIRNLRVVFLFLLAYWLYIDGVDTIVRMAMDYGLSLGFEQSSLMIALLVTQLVGFPAALVFGFVGQRVGPKKAIWFAIGVYIAVVGWGYRMSELWEFYALAVVVGLVQGGIQALSRSLYARLIPRDKTAEFFGFYNMLGKFAAVLGPVTMGWVALVTGSVRVGILSVSVLFALGALVLYFVDVEEGERAAARL